LISLVTTCLKNFLVVTSSDPGVKFIYFVKGNCLGDLASTAPFKTLLTNVSAS
jgi:hypothetical protein